MPPSLFPRLGETLGECEQERETRWRLETESPALAIVTGDTHFSIRYTFLLLFLWLFAFCLYNFVERPACVWLTEKPRKTYYSRINNAISWGPSETRQKQKAEKIEKKSKPFLHSYRTHITPLPLSEYSAFNRALHSI